jgi:hypothetical protein
MLVNHLPVARNLTEANRCADPDIGLLPICPPSTDAVETAAKGQSRGESQLRTG